MVRTRQTGGIVPAAQYLVYDELSGRFANGTLRITSRQTFQFHGVAQRGIGALIKSINEALSTTLATCGDVNRNVTAPTAPPVDAVTRAVEEDAFAVTTALMPRVTAYHSIWVEGVQLDLGLGQQVDRAALHAEVTRRRQAVAAVVASTGEDHEAIAERTRDLGHAELRSALEHGPHVRAPRRAHQQAVAVAGVPPREHLRGQDVVVAVAECSSRGLQLRADEAGYATSCEGRLAHTGGGRVPSESNGLQGREALHGFLCARWLHA
jgi:hypothetical protein